MKIAFVAKAGGGKTSLARYLRDRYGFDIHGFATKVKYFASLVLDRPICKGADRTFLQMLGDGARHSNSIVWINYVDVVLPCKGSIVIDDCRYLNEAEYLKAEGFSLVRLEGRGYNLAPENAEHPSETEQLLIACDFEIDVSGTLEESFNNLESVLDWLRYRNDSSK